MKYTLYNADRPVATFAYDKGVITEFNISVEHLLPMQIRQASAEGFAQWLRERAINLNTFLHRQLTNELVGSRDKTAVAIMTHMFSVSDTFTCFTEGEFIPRNELCKVEDQDNVSDFILSSGEVPLRNCNIPTPNASTDGSFPKTWKFENGAWWLYKLQSATATRSERDISHVLMECGWNAAEYQYCGSYRNRIKSRNFVGEDEFFEPYDSLRFMFADKSDDEEVIYENIASLGSDFEKQFRRILLADTLFMNTDRHMRNYGVIRSAKTGEILRMAPNFDNNQAYKSNPSGHYSDGMLKSFLHVYELRTEDIADLNLLLESCATKSFLADVCEVGHAFLNKYT